MTGDGVNDTPALLGFVYLDRCRSCSAPTVDLCPVGAGAGRPLLLLAAEEIREAVARRAVGRWLGRSARSRRATRP
jgi:hypothetical protein